MIGVMQLSALSDPLQGVLQGGDCEFGSVCTDSRSLRQGELYLALRGERFDGNDYTGAAAEKGACGAIVSRFSDARIPQLMVGDTLVALGQVAKINRQRSSAHVIALTGSQGKTTVKEMLGCILRQLKPTLVTRGNLNNRIGVPLTLLDLNEEHRYAVIELGANGAGEIADTVDMTEPHVVLINNATATHLEGFGSVEGVILAKGEIIDGCADDGVVVLNADDPAFERWRERAGNRRVVGFSLQAESRAACYTCAEVTLHETSSVFTLRAPAGDIKVTLPVPGKHNIANALASAAAALESGISLQSVASGLRQMSSVPGRMDISIAGNGLLLIDDSYNASPSSFRAAVDVLMALGRSRNARTLLVAGDMAELGETSPLLHSQCGEYARESGVDALWCTGTLCRLMADAFGTGAEHFPDRDALMLRLEEAAAPDMVVLVKGSRSAGMEKIVDRLRNREGC